MAKVTGNIQILNPVLQLGQAARIAVTLTNVDSIAAQLISAQTAWLTNTGAQLLATTNAGEPFPLGPGFNNPLITGPAPGTPGIGGNGNTIPANSSATWIYYDIPDYDSGPNNSRVNEVYWISVYLGFSDGTVLFPPPAQVTLVRYNAAFLSPSPTYATAAVNQNEIGYDMTTAGASFFQV